MIKKKFLDPNIKNKSKKVEDKIQLFDYAGVKLPLPTEIEISESGTCNRSCSFCPRSAKEIADMFNEDITTITKGCKKFDEIGNLDSSKNISVSNTTTSPVDFIERFCSKLNLGENIVGICTHVCQKADEYSFVDKCIPPSIAAGSIFLVCNILNINISKKEISSTCRISEVTISKCYKELLRYHKYLFPENIINKLYS